MLSLLLAPLRRLRAPVVVLPLLLAPQATHLAIKHPAHNFERFVGTRFRLQRLHHGISSLALHHGISSIARRKRIPTRFHKRLSQMRECFKIEDGCEGAKRDRDRHRERDESSYYKPYAMLCYSKCFFDGSTSLHSEWKHRK